MKGVVRPERGLVGTTYRRLGPAFPASSAEFEKAETQDGSCDL